MANWRPVVNIHRVVPNWSANDDFEALSSESTRERRVSDMGRKGTRQQKYATELFQIHEAFVDAATKFCPFCKLILSTGLQEFCFSR